MTQFKNHSLSVNNLLKIN